MISHNTEKIRSNWWFLLPIFFGIIGGVIAFFILRKDDPKKAKNCFFLGMVLGVIGIALDLLFSSQISQIEQNFGVNL